MRPAQYFENQVNQFFNKKTPEDEEVLNGIERLLDKTIGFLPEDMLKDLLESYYELYNNKRGAYRDFKEMALRLSEVVALFTGDYGDSDAGLDQEDWILLRDLVSDYASELDERFLTDVMSQVVSRGYI